MTKVSVESVLKRHDAGESAETISATLSVSVGHVYSILRVHRPDRPRKVHKTTSDVPRMIAGLHGQGIKPARIAAVLGVSRAYVYRHIGSGK